MLRKAVNFFFRLDCIRTECVRTDNHPIKFTAVMPEVFKNSICMLKRKLSVSSYLCRKHLKNQIQPLTRSVYT